MKLLILIFIAMTACDLFEPEENNHMSQEEAILWYKNKGFKDFVAAMQMRGKNDKITKKDVQHHLNALDMALNTLKIGFPSLKNANLLLILIFGHKKNKKLTVEDMIAMSKEKFYSKNFVLFLYTSDKRGISHKYTGQTEELIMQIIWFVKYEPQIALLSN